MEKDAFIILRNIENTWWHFGRQQAVEQAIRSLGTLHTTSALDVGAGYGGMFSLLSPYGVVDGIEPEPEAAQVSKERGYHSFFASEIDVLTEEKQYDIVGAFDVIEHVKDDTVFVSNLYNLTKQGGILVATVPAFQWLWSKHDVTHKHFRRHTVKSMTTLLRGAGYSVVYRRYWNTFLFIPAVLMRMFGKSGESSLHPHPFIAELLQSILWLEVRIIRYIYIPFGLSVVIVGEKR